MGPPGPRGHCLGGEGSDSLEGNEGDDRWDARDAGRLTDTLNGGPESDLCFWHPTDVPPSLDQRDC